MHLSTWENQNIFSIRLSTILIERKELNAISYIFDLLDKEIC